MPLTLRRLCFATALLLSFPFATQAWALPITWRSADDAWRLEAAGRWMNLVQILDVKERIVPMLPTHREVPDVAPRPRNPIDDKPLAIPAPKDRPGTSQEPLSVPEPGTLALAGLGAAIGLRRARRRR